MTDHRISFAGVTNSATPAALIETLNGFGLVIRVSPQLPPMARLAVASLISVLVRVFPSTVIEGGHLRLLRNPWNAATLDDLLTILSPVTPSSSINAERRYVIGVGADITDADLWMGGNDWTAAIGRSPQKVEDGFLGLGLQAAAALTAAEVMKEALQDFDSIRVFMQNQLHWNLMNYQLSWHHELHPATFQKLHIMLAGAGSVGSTLAGLLVLTPVLRGEAIIVDTDAFDPTRNGLRYPMSTGTEQGAKALWLGGLLAANGWRSTPVVSDVANWCSRSATPGYNGFVVSSVDTVSGRLDVADLLAATTLSIGVGGLALHLQRETLGDGWACPFCEYVELDAPMTQVQVLSDMTGLSIERVAVLQDSGAPLSHDDIAAAVAANKLDVAEAEVLIGRRLDDLAQRAYADAVVQVPDSAPAAVSAPYVSLMAGVLGAAELAKASMGLPMVNRRVDLDLAGVPLGTVGRRPAKTNCICNQGVRRRWMNQLHKNNSDAMTSIYVPQSATA